MGDAVSVYHDDHHDDDDVDDDVHVDVDDQQRW